MLVYSDPGSLIELHPTHKLYIKGHEFIISTQCLQPANISKHSLIALARVSQQLSSPLVSVFSINQEAPGKSTKNSTMVFTQMLTLFLKLLEIIQVTQFLEF